MRTRTALAALTAVAALGTAATATALTASEESRLTPADAEAPAAIAKTPTEQTEAFSVLSRPARAGDAPVSGATAGPYGANPALARKVQTGAGPAWVVPADGHVCLRVPTDTGSAWTCQTVEQAKAGRLVLTLRDANRRVAAAYAVLPDGAGAPRMTSGKTATAASLDDNVVGSTSPTATALAYTDADGAAQNVDLP